MYNIIVSRPLGKISLVSLYLLYKPQLSILFYLVFHFKSWIFKNIDNNYINNDSFKSEESLLKKFINSKLSVNVNIIKTHFLMKYDL